jgi:hypothetical protein
MFRNKICFFHWGIVSTLSKPQAGGPSRFGCLWLLIQCIRFFPPYWKPFLHPQPEDAPCHGHWDPLITEDYCTFMMMSRGILLRMRNVSNKSCRENQNTHFIFSNFFNCSVYEVMWKNTVELDRPHVTVWHMCIACWVPKTTNTLTICSIYCFLTATVVEKMCFNVALYVRCLSC